MNQQAAGNYIQEDSRHIQESRPKMVRFTTLDFIGKKLRVVVVKAMALC